MAAFLTALFANDADRAFLLGAWTAAAAFVWSRVLMWLWGVYRQGL